jgi:hypothetical protein
MARWTQRVSNEERIVSPVRRTGALFPHTGTGLLRIQSAFDPRPVIKTLTCLT